MVDIVKYSVIEVKFLKVYKKNLLLGFLFLILLVICGNNKWFVFWIDYGIFFNVVWFYEKIKFFVKIYVIKVVFKFFFIVNGIIYFFGVEDKYYEDLD